MKALCYLHIYAMSLWNNDIILTTYLLSLMYLIKYIVQIISSFISLEYLDCILKSIRRCQRIFSEEYIFTGHFVCWKKWLYFGCWQVKATYFVNNTSSFLQFYVTTSICPFDFVQICELCFLTAFVYFLCQPTFHHAWFLEQSPPFWINPFRRPFFY